MKYHPHVLRGTNITFAKDAGFPPDWAEWLAGHEVGTRTHYLPTFEKASEKWEEPCESRFCFLEEDTAEKVEEVQKQINELVERAKRIEAKGETIIKQQETPQPPTLNGQAKRWENHAFYYAKCEYRSKDFDKLLEEGYEQFGTLTKDSFAYMRKPKQVA